MKETSGRRADKLICSLVTLLLLGGCVTNPISYDSASPVTHGVLFEYPYFKDQVTGITVSQQEESSLISPAGTRTPFIPWPKFYRTALCTPIPATIGTGGERTRRAIPKPISSAYRVSLSMTTIFSGSSIPPRLHSKGWCREARRWSRSTSLPESSSRSSLLMTLQPPQQLP